MPGPASHMFIAERVAQQFSPIRDINITRLTSGVNEPYYKLGSTGPDLFFFAPDYEVILYPSLVLPYVRDVVLPVKALYDDIIAPVAEVIEDVEEGAQAVLDEATCDAYSTLEDRVDALLQNLSSLRDSFIAYIFSESFNMFDLMRPPLQNGKDESQWFWFDILHYRRTGQFLQTMWDNSDTDAKKAYVLGYATHVAADVAGHPYVNQAVGGPARSHNQRHHFVENILDTWFYDEALSQNITNAQLHRQLPHGEELDDEGTLLAILEGTDSIPADMQGIFSMISKSMENTFPANELPNLLPDGVLKPQDINLAYWLLMASLKISTDSFVPRPEEPFSDALDAIAEAAEEFLNNVQNPPQPPGSPAGACFAFWESDCDFSLDALEDWLEYMWDNIVYLGEIIEWVASILKDLYDILVCTITAPLKILVSSLLWLLQSAVYAIVEEIRNALVLAAILHPQPDWVRNHPIAREIVELSDRSWIDIKKKNYPRRAQESNEGFLGYPNTRVEMDPTTSGPYPAGTTPFAFVDGIPGRVNNEGLYQKYDQSESPAATRNIEFGSTGVYTFPAVPLAVELFQGLLEGDVKIPDWNLDADRGYHYKNWRASWEKLSWDSTDAIDDSWHL